GNPTHPYSQTVKGRSGSADALAQAAILEIYDPERSQGIIDRLHGSDVASDWNTFAAALNSALNSVGLAILSEASSSQTFARLKSSVLKRFPNAALYEYEAISRDNEIGASKDVFGKPVRQVLHLDKAKIVALFDADPLGTHPAHVHYAGDWASNRPSEDGDWSRVYCVESAMTISGSV